MSDESSGTRKPLKTGRGMLAKYGPAPTAAEIDENRREMLQGFGERWEGGDEISSKWPPEVVAILGTWEADFPDVESLRRSNPLLARVTVDPDVRFGKPCLRGHRITVQEVFEWLATGATQEQIIADYPGLEAEDFRAVFAWAAEMAGKREHRLGG